MPAPGGITRSELLRRAGLFSTFPILAGAGGACTAQRTETARPATEGPDPPETPDAGEAGTPPTPSVDTGVTIVEAPPPQQPLPIAAPGPVDVAGARLRVLGVGIDSIDPVRHVAERDLGIVIESEITDQVELVERARLDPASFDVLAGDQSVYDAVWASGNLAPIELSSVGAWPDVGDLFRTGRFDPASSTCVYGDGDAPFRTLYVDVEDDRGWPSSSETIDANRGSIVQWVDELSGATLGPEPRFVAGVPFVYSLDSIGYNGDVIDRDPEQISWGDLFDEAYSGRVALLGEPTLGLQDAGNAARGLGLLDFGSVGNMTRLEIDALLKILDVLKRKDHFRAFVTTIDQSLALMASGEVVAASMSSQAIALLASQGLNARYAAPPEGYRAWAACLSVSASTTDERTRAAALAYINWWLSGEPGAIMMRQGYYSPVQEASRRYASADEWRYWIDGEPTTTDLAGVTGSVGDVLAGSRRDGGSLATRACNLSCWNSYFAEDAYLRLRWREFVEA